MLKKIVNFLEQIKPPRRGGFVLPFIDRDLLGDVISLSIRKINLERQLRDARTRASKNGCLALLAFGLIAIEILGVVLYFLPK